MATAEIDSQEHGHDDEHEHPKWLAHHFDTPEQQFDSGKLGMWLFLITEILFFSGLFCAYAIYRSLRPEVYTFASQFLNTELGAINTGVLLFSSLTMAWAVRAAQLEQHKTTVGMLAATIGCAMIFLGVKAVEYSHKWELGLLPAGTYCYEPAYLEHHHELKLLAPVISGVQGNISGAVETAERGKPVENLSALIGDVEEIKTELDGYGVKGTAESLDLALLHLRQASTAPSELAAASELDKAKLQFDTAAGKVVHPPFLTILCVVPAIILIGLICFFFYAKAIGCEFKEKIAMPLIVAAACYFVGVGLGIYLESGESHDSEQSIASAHGGDGVVHVSPAVEEEIAEEEIAVEQAADPSNGEEVVLSLLAEDSKNTGVIAEINAQKAQNSIASGAFVETPSENEPFLTKAEQDVNSNSLAGVFFSIYYCMTGLHAIHIIIGIGVLTWLLVRTVREDFNKHYFGPVDYVGLYWHIVDLIWIYLFPLLYLIG